MSMKNDVFITQNDIPKLLTYFSTYHRLDVFKSISLVSINSFNLCKCLKLLSTQSEQYDALLHNSEIEILSLEHKLEIIKIFSNNKNYQPKVRELLSNIKISRSNYVELRSVHASQSPPPYSQHSSYLSDDEEYNQKEKQLCKCNIS
jgi:hypothetical protein